MAPHASLRGALTALTASLIGSSVAQAVGPNSTETSILIYSEQDRTRATEAAFNYNKALKHDIGLNLRLTFDALSGATPTGASPSKYAQTLTRPSGGQVVLVPAGQHPVDDSFHDTRYAVDATFSRPLSRLATGKLGARWSGEADYKSLGLNIGFTQDLNRRNTTLGLSAAINHDVVNPVGGFYAPLSEVGTLGNETPDERRARFEGREKNVYDVVLSVAQVLDRKTALRLSGSVTRANGYLTDPYKVFSVVQPADSTDPGEPVTALYENRPGWRQQNAVMAQMKRQVGGGAADVSYRFFWDDWGVHSHSVDLAWHVAFVRRTALIPRVRWYRQSAADFHVPFVVHGEPTPTYASADSRLAEFQALTFGMGCLVPVKPGTNVSLSVEYYRQRGDVPPPDVLGTSVPVELFPRLDVIMIRLGYAHEFF